MANKINQIKVNNVTYDVQDVGLSCSVNNITTGISELSGTVDNICNTQSVICNTLSAAIVDVARHDTVLGNISGIVLNNYSGNIIGVECKVKGPISELWDDLNEISGKVANHDTLLGNISGYVDSLPTMQSVVNLGERIDNVSGKVNTVSGKVDTNEQNFSGFVDAYNTTQFYMMQNINSISSVVNKLPTLCDTSTGVMQIKKDGNTCKLHIGIGGSVVSNRGLLHVEMCDVQNGSSIVTLKNNSFELKDICKIAAVNNNDVYIEAGSTNERVFNDVRIIPRNSNGVLAFDYTDLIRVGTQIYQIGSIVSGIAAAYGTTTLNV